MTDDVNPEIARGAGSEAFARLVAEAAQAAIDRLPWGFGDEDLEREWQESEEA